MVSRKREDPFTPDHKRGLEHKKLKDHVPSPHLKTPLRNVLTPGRSGTGSAVQSTSKKPAADLVRAGAMLGSSSRSRLASSVEAMDSGEQEGRKKRQEAHGERRRTRKTDLMSPAANSSPKAAPPQALSGPGMRRKGSEGALAVGAGSGNTPVASVISGETAHRPLPSSNGKPKMTAEQMNRVFEEWIKIAADNKINAKNTWNLALIDYFSELNFVRDGTSINFQKASCTLDGCVKIYASRVDSVVDETGKLINGLADGNWKSGRSLEDEEGADGGAAPLPEDEEEGGRKRHVKKASQHASTLEKSHEALSLKQFDLEHAIDPLFRKTCAEFDGNNGRGMLLHNLSLSSTCQVVFDSSDSGRLESAAVAVAAAAAAPADTGSTVNIGTLKSAFALQLASVAERRLCAPFAEYRLGESGSATFSADQMAKAMERLARITMLPIAEQPPRSHMMEIDGQVFDAPAGGLEDGGAPPMDDDYGADVSNCNYDFDETDLPGFEGGLSAGEDALHVDASGELVEEATEGFSRSPAAGTNMFSYFDESLTQAWAGPNHWKVRRRAFIRPSAPVASRPTPRKKDFSLQFGACPDIDIELLFAKPANPATITLTKTQIEERSRRDNMLPEDLHFSSVNFLRLFTKPFWRFGAAAPSRVFKLRPVEAVGGGADGPAAAGPPPQEEVQGEFWARNEGRPDGVADVTFGGEEDVNASPFDGVNLDDDYGGSEDGGASGLVPTQEAFAGSTQVSNFGLDLVALKAGVQVQRLAFSRVAKRVDVHRLKQAIWEEIAVDVRPAAQSESQPGTRFSALVSQLGRTSYPREGLKDVSVSYCFICLLHLANENGLALLPEGADLIVKSVC